MGVSSFTTADTQESVVLNNYDHPNSNRTVYMLMPNGEPNVAEQSYNGYANFGGVDAFEWLSRMNGGEVHVGDDGEEHFHRDDGIDMFYDEEATLEYPLKFSYDKDAVYEKIKGISQSCEFQGLPPHPNVEEAIKKGVSFTLADMLHESFDLTDEGIIPAAKLLDSLFNSHRKRYSEPDYDFLPDCKAVAKEVDLAVSDETANKLMNLVSELGFGRFGEEDFSEFIALIHEGNQPKNTEIEVAPDQVDNRPVQRPKR